MPRERETIERAAVRFRGVVYDVPRPQRHDAAIRACYEKAGLDPNSEEDRCAFAHDPGHEQGFVTSTGRFVDRYVAARIAFKAGQTNWTRIPSVGIITSENLW